MGNFNYDEAFSRNIGWVTQAEQDVLRNKRVAIAGMGGAGGNYLITLIRLGVSHFRIADFDTFDLVNFNRQVGASLSTLNQSKVDVMVALAKDINPEADIQVYREVNEGNLSEFLNAVDIYLDGLDFFAFEARAATFAACHSMGIPAVTVAPIGMGAALINFMPGGMSFERYFLWHNCDDTEKALRFLAGLAPARLQAPYLVEPSAVSLAKQRGPSTFMACQLCAGIAVTEALKILLNRGKVWAAPHSIQFDAFRNKFVRIWRPGGNNHPLQKLAIFFGKRQFGKSNAGAQK